MKKIYLAFILVFVFQILTAQKQNNIWYFGDFAGLDFNSGFPMALTNSSLTTNEGSASISDSSGALLFYTNGVTVWDKNHNAMPNGDSLYGSVSSTQAAVIVPFPNNSMMYYIFTTQSRDLYPNPIFSYSVVDMSLNNGNGDISIKNIFLSDSVSEKLTAIPHSNGTDIWVMIHLLNHPDFLAYLVTSSGVMLTPVISTAGQSWIKYDAIGYMKFSFDATKIAFASQVSNYVELFDFNSTTGIVTNVKRLNCPPSSSYGAYGLEFSHNGNNLYATMGNSPGKVEQWDITSNNDSIINSTIQQVGISASFLETIQLGPDGKIYVAEWLQTHLGVINNPNVYGVSCGYVDSAVSLNGRTCRIGLPNYIQGNYVMTATNEFEFNSNYLIYPNPFNDVISISLNKENLSIATFTIKNTLGQIVYKQQENNIISNYTKTIDLSFLSKGIYLLDVIIDGERTVKKIMKQ